MPPSPDRWPRRWASLAAWPIEAEALLSVAAVASSLLLFLIIAGSVLNGGFRALDEGVLLAMRNPLDPGDPIGPKWFEGFVRDMTALGSTGVLTLLVAAALLSAGSATAHRWIRGCFGRWPKGWKRIEKFRRRLRRWFHRDPDEPRP